MNSIVVIGPQQWCIDHKQWLDINGTTAMQYSPKNNYVSDAKHRLVNMQAPFWMLVYVPRKINGQYGSGTIEYACRVIDLESSDHRTKSPWPTFKLDPSYRKHDDDKYEFWFKVDHMEQSVIPFDNVTYYLQNESVSRYANSHSLVGAARGRILFGSWNESINITKAIEEIEHDVESSGAFDPSDETDARERTIASIVTRRGQPAFRQALLAAYNGKCAVTGCDTFYALEAAHITPYRGDHTNAVENGILLRADIHTLFDLGLIAISPNDFKVILRDDLRTGFYGDLHGQPIALPSNRSELPNREALEAHKISSGL